MFKKIVAGLVVVFVVGAFGWTHRDQVMARMSCADKVAHQYAADHIVPGAYNCLNPDQKYILALLYKVNNAQDFAVYAGTSAKYSPSYTYLGETIDNGYVYKIEAYAKPHSVFQPAFQDLTQGNLQAAWAELNGETQGGVSLVVTFYLFPSGSTGFPAMDGKSYDVSGELAYIAITQ